MSNCTGQTTSLFEMDWGLKCDLLIETLDYIKSESQKIKPNHHYRIKTYTMSDFDGDYQIQRVVNNGDCIVVVSKETNKVIVIHVKDFNCSLSNMIDEINGFLAYNSNCEIIIKLPEEYEKNDDGKWETVLKRKSFYETCLPTHQITFIPYQHITDISSGQTHNWYLFIRFDKETQTYSYTNNWGRYITI